MGKIYRELSRRYGWTAKQIGGMTESQQLMYLQKDGDEPDTLTFDTVAEARAYQAQVNAGG